MAVHRHGLLMTPADHPAHATIEACARCAQQRNCATCFEELVRRYQVSLLHYVLRRVHSQHDAEDLVQETFLLAYRNFRQYQPEWRFSTWLFTIAHRLTVSAWRRRQNQPVNSEPLESMESKEESDPLHWLSEKDSRSALWEVAREALSGDAVAALWMNYVESMSAEEIGQVLGRNANAVRILLHRARVRLAEQIAVARFWEVNNE